VDMQVRAIIEAEHVAVLFVNIFSMRCSTLQSTFVSGAQEGSGLMTTTPGRHMNCGKVAGCFVQAFRHTCFTLVMFSLWCLCFCADHKVQSSCISKCQSPVVVLYVSIIINYFAV
jgi:hypothetical protein